MKLPRAKPTLNENFDVLVARRAISKEARADDPMEVLEY